MAYTIDDLLAELDAQLNVANIENHRDSVARHIRRIMERVGFRLIAQEFQEKMQIRAHRLELPPYIQTVLDGGETADYGEFYEMTTEMQSNKVYAFRKSGTGLHFPNTANATVYVKFLGLDKDESGNTIIPDVVYEACHDYALGQVLKTLPLHPRRGEADRLVYRAEQELVPQARASLMPDSEAHHRTNRHYMGSQRVRQN